MALTFKSICVVILLYKADRASANRLARTCIEQGGSVLFVNNDQIDFDPLLPLGDLIINVINNGSNLGVSVGYNVGIDFAAEHGFENVLLLDQDSTLPENLISGGLNLLLAEPGLSIVAPRICNHGKLISGQKFPILSGMIIRLLHWPTIGPLDENIFVDFVDYELSMRSLKPGVNFKFIDILMYHSIGVPKVFLRTYSVHDPIRLGGMIIDAAYVCRKTDSYHVIYLAFVAVIKNILLSPSNLYLIMKFQFKAYRVISNSAPFSRG